MPDKRLSDKAFHKLEAGLHAQVERWRTLRQQKALPQPGRRPFLTLSREFGCEAFPLAEALAKKLNAAHPTPAGWEVYDRMLMEKIGEDYQLSEKLLESFETSISRELDDYLETLFSKENLQIKAFHGLVRTVRALALQGNCIIVGRGGAILTRDLPGGVHIRLVASFDWRVKKMMDKRHLSQREAQDLIREADRAREGYIRKYLNKDHRDSGFYHLMINTERISRDVQIELILTTFSLTINN